MYATVPRKVAVSLGVRDEARLVVLAYGEDPLQWVRENLENQEGVENKYDAIPIDAIIDGRRYAYLHQEEIVFAWLPAA